MRANTFTSRPGFMYKNNWTVVFFFTDMKIPVNPQTSIWSCHSLVMPHLTALIELAVWPRVSY